MGAAVTSDGNVRLPAPYPGPPAGRWYGQDPAWRIPMEAAARRRYGHGLRADLRRGSLTYDLDRLTVAGRSPVAVRVVFDAVDREHHFGLPARDYPTVHADPGAESKHRNSDDSLCLYYPLDPPERRWHSELGLAILFDLVADHLFAELYWRQTGGHRGGEWVISEAPHGLQQEPA